MKIADLAKVRGSRVCGIDCSTNSLAFAIFEDNAPVVCGEVRFNGSNVFERLHDAKRKTRALVDLGILKADFIGIESAVMVRNNQTVISLAYVYGAVMGELMEGSPVVEQIAPIQWQSYYGVKNLTAKDKDRLREMFPNKSASWYQNKGRKLRKERILQKSKEFFDIDDDSDNVGDAVGIAYYVASTRVV